MVKSGSYQVKQGNIFGRIGQGLGQGLAEQLPKEVDRARLSSGLKELGNQKGLSPFQQFAQLSSIPGVTPQMIQSGSELLRQQGISNALIQKSQEERQSKSSPFPKSKSSLQENGLSPSITTRTPIEATLENYIPKTFEQIQERAGQLMQESPELYASDPQKALSAAETEEKQNQAINQALQTRRQNEQDVQNRIESGLKNQATSLGAIVPGNVFSEIEDKAINAVKPKDQGGEGLTEQQSKKKYGKELDDISRDYKSIETVGNLSVLSRKPEETKRELRSIGKKFKERDDQENLADTYISKNGLSPGKAYYLAYPVSDVKELNNAIVKLPELKSEMSFKKGYPEKAVPENILRDKTLSVSKEIAPLLGKNGSPLSVAEELQSRNYDPNIWLDYLDKNRKKLNLTERQARELDKPRNNFPSLNDNWLFYFSGLDKLVEQ